MFSALAWAVQSRSDVAEMVYCNIWKQITVRHGIPLDICHLGTAYSVNNCKHQHQQPYTKLTARITTHLFFQAFNNKICITIQLLRWNSQFLGSFFLHIHKITSKVTIVTGTQCYALSEAPYWESTCTVAPATRCFCIYVAPPREWKRIGVFTVCQLLDYFGIFCCKFWHK